MEGRNHITAPECMKKEDTSCFLRSYSWNHLVYCDPFCLYSFAKTYPHFLKAKLHQREHNRYGYNNNIRVIGIDHPRFVSFIHCILSMLENMCISFFMTAWIYPIQVCGVIADSMIPLVTITLSNETVLACYLHHVGSFASLIEFFLCPLLSP